MNTVLLAGSIVLGAACFGLIRQQTAITDTQFLRSMIPHHAGALLVCAKALIEESAIKELCRGIIASQQAEIDQMKALLLLKQ